MIIFKTFQQKIFFICTIYPVYGKEKLNWPSLPRWSQFLFLKHIFLFSFLFQFLVYATQNKILFRFSSQPYPLFNHQIHDFLYSINSFSKFNQFFIRVSVYQIKLGFFYVMFYHDSFQMYLVLQYLTQ
jgi:hypothetical protein